MTFVDKATCEFQYDSGIPSLLAQDLPVRYIADDQICASVGVCSGDSGGPLIRKSKSNNNNEDDVLVGIVSWTRGGCDDLAFPDVFTSISYHYDWIVKTACDLSKDVPYDCAENKAAAKVAGIEEDSDGPSQTPLSEEESP
jgi:secreted trypsin-like serine protease